jgi:hypothetical protein
MLLILTLSPEEQALWQGRSAMVVALTDREADALRQDVILAHEGMSVLAASLTAFVDGREAQGVTDPELRAAMDDIAGHLMNCHAMIDRARELLGRAVFIGPQEQKGPVQ